MPLQLFFAKIYIDHQYDQLLSTRQYLQFTTHVIYFYFFILLFKK